MSGLMVRRNMAKDSRAAAAFTAVITSRSSVLMSGWSSFTGAASRWPLCSLGASCRRLRLKVNHLVVIRIRLVIRSQSIVDFEQVLDQLRPQAARTHLGERFVKRQLRLESHRRPDLGRLRTAQQ